MNNQIIFVGNFVSFVDSRTHPAFSQAANLYQTKFVDFIKPRTAISILPIFYSEKRKFSFHRQVHFINNQLGLRNKLNYAYRLVTDTIEALRLIGKDAAHNVFFYNLDQQNLLLVWLTKKWLRRKTYVIVADYGYYGNSFMSRLFNRILSGLDGVIVLNSNICCNPNYRLLPGLLYKEQIIIRESGILNRNVMLSGSLGKTTGLELALEFFSQHQEHCLFITGRPFRYTQEEFDELIQKYTRNAANIKYLGLLSYEEYLSTLEQCDIALSLRNPADDEHEYNFPSKILEYLSKSKMVVSSKSYRDIPEGLLFYTGFDSDSLEAVFRSIQQMTADKVIERRREIYRYLRDHFTEDSLKTLVNQLVAKSNVGN